MLKNPRDPPHYQHHQFQDFPESIMLCYLALLMPHCREHQNGSILQTHTNRHQTPLYQPTQHLNLGLPTTHHRFVHSVVRLYRLFKRACSTYQSESLLLCGRANKWHGWFSADASLGCIQTGALIYFLSSKFVHKLTYVNSQGRSI